MMYLIICTSVIFVTFFLCDAQSFGVPTALRRDSLLDQREGPGSVQRGLWTRPLISAGTAEETSGMLILDWEDI